MLALKQALSLVSTPKLGLWSPDDESSLEAWWQNAVGITLNGSRVAKWDDSSGKGHDMSQIGTAQPEYADGILTFDGTDDNLASNQINLATISNCTIAIRGDFSSGTGTLLGDDDGTTAFINFQSTTVLRLRVAAGLIDFTLASGTFGDGYIVITRNESNLVNAYYNGVEISAAQARGGLIKIDNMGSYSTTGFFDGTIKEVQIFTSQSAALTANINSRLAGL
mgnify:CR=1 FL=1|tara:strand:- start:38 stop:706 length:669 start_codon:yes stop_codon:yes gene_type:complete